MPMMNLGARDSGSARSPWDRRDPLDSIFAARSVAVVGATEKAGSVGRGVLWNLMNTPFGGPIYPVNPTRPSVLGIKAYPKLSALPEKPDLVVVTTPAPSVPTVIAEAADLGIPAAVVIPGGFRETGPAGLELERQILAHARRGHLRLIGPNCLGVMNPISGVNASCAAAMARRGNVAFISQSGALCAAVLDWALREMVGFSAFVSIGSMLDVGWGDLISYLGDDPNTKSIVIYMESIGDARAFLSAAREVALTKPILVLKPGLTESTPKPVPSSVGSHTEPDDVFEAAFKRCGVLRVNSISDLFHLSEVLARQPRPQGNRLTILTNAAGPGKLAVNALLATGGVLAEMSRETLAELDKFLPPVRGPRNPIELTNTAGADLYARAVETAGRDPSSDGLLVILTPQTMTDATATAEKVKVFGHTEGKPVLASWMGGDVVAAGEAILNRADVPTFAYPDTAAMAFTSMFRFSENLRALYETPVLSADPTDLASGRARAHSLIESVKSTGRTVLTEAESKDLLACYGIPAVVTRIAGTADEAAKLAGQIGFPVVLKLYSETVTHKAEVGGVQLNLENQAGVRQAFHDIQAAVTQAKGSGHFQGVTVQKMSNLARGYELILGSSIDPEFGPVLLFGMGGQLVEVFRDKALGFPPLNTTLARRMMETTRIYKALRGVQGRPPVGLAALEKLLVGFSQLVAEQRWIREIEINPLFASADELVALDARVVLQDPETAEDHLPKLAIRPYPTQYVDRWTTKDSLEVAIRPIRPEDEPAMVRFHEGLSERSVYLRYFSPLKLQQRVAHDRLIRICFNDYDREIALVAEHKDPAGPNEILAVARLSKLHATSTAEFAVVVTDTWQNKGLGTELTRRLVQVARNEKLSRLLAYALQENYGMLTMCKKLGFKVRREAGEAECLIEMEL